MDILFSQLSIAEDGFESYYKGELRNLDQLFNTTDTALNQSEEKKNQISIEAEEFAEEVEESKNLKEFKRISFCNLTHRI